MSDRTRSITARWVFPGSSEPIADSTIQISDGLIEDIHSSADPNAEDAGNVAVIPGLINAHTHLEFSDLRAPLGPVDSFTGWIQSVVSHRRGSDSNVDEIIADGIAESAAAGTTTIGETATQSGQPAAKSPGGSPRIVSFRECLAATMDSVADQLKIATDHLLQRATDRFIPALSPHAPYSVCNELFYGLTKLARERNVPLAMHLFETPEEMQFLDKADGPFVDMLQTFGVWDSSRATSMLQPMDYLKELATCPHALVVHGNYLTSEQCEFIGGHDNISVVFCPRTHAYFNHSPHCWQHLLAAGANVAIGTDSRASNPDLSVFEELKWLARRFPEIDRRIILQMATVNSAWAMGLCDSGQLEVGLNAEMTVVQLPDADGDPYELLFHPDSRVVLV